MNTETEQYDPDIDELLELLARAKCAVHNQCLAEQLTSVFMTQAWERLTEAGAFVQRLAERLSKAEEDKARLDWLEYTVVRLDIAGIPPRSVYKGSTYEPSIREAIDAARNPSPALEVAHQIANAINVDGPCLGQSDIQMIAAIIEKRFIEPTPQP